MKAHTYFTVISTLAQIITIGKKHFFWRPFRIPKLVTNLKLDENYERYNIKRTVGAEKNTLYKFYYRWAETMNACRDIPQYTSNDYRSNFCFGTLHISAVKKIAISFSLL